MAEQTEEEKTAAQAAYAAAEKLRAAEDAKIKAEAELTAYKSAMEAAAREKSTGQAVWTDEQWTAFEAQNPGVTRQSLVINQTLAKQQIDALRSDLEAKTTEAEKRAKAAEDRAARLESDRIKDRVKTGFFKDNPALSRYEKEIDEFLGHFPETDRNDPDKLKALLPLAKDYVKGKVGDKMRSNTGAPRFEEGNTGRTGEEGTEEPDFARMNPQERAFMQRIYPGVKEREKELKDYEMPDGNGIVISAKHDFDDARKKLKERYPGSSTVI